jgi:hypothetical protein
LKEKKLILFVLFLSWATDAFYRFVPIASLNSRRILIFGPTLLIMLYFISMKQGTINRNFNKYKIFFFFYFYMFIVDYLIFRESFFFATLSIKGVIVIFFVLLFLKGEKDVRNINMLLLGWGVLNAFVCVAQQVFPDLISFAQSGLEREVGLQERAREFGGMIARGSNGLHVTPSVTALILGFSSIISFNYFLYTKDKNRYGLLTVLVIIGLIFTNRRLMLMTVILTMSISTIVFVRLTKKTQRVFGFFLTLIGSVILLSIIYPSFFQAATGRFLTDINIYEEKKRDHVKVSRMNAQVNMWQGHFNLFLDSPLYGYGNGDYFAATAKKKVHRNYDPHSSYTGILVHFGLIGFIFLFVLYYRSVSNYLFVIKYSPQVDYIASAMVAFAFIIYQIGGTYYDDPIGLTFIGIGFLSAERKLAKMNYLKSYSH